MRRAIVLLCAAHVLVGCATQEWIYEKPGVTPARLDHDIATCQKEALDPRAVAIRASERIDREVFNRCMARKGYTARTAE